jgi:hypothetical protein
MEGCDTAMQLQKDSEWINFLKKICIKSNLFIKGKETEFEESGDVNYRDAVNELSKSIFKSVFHGVDCIKFNDEVPVQLLNVKSNFLLK